MTDQEQHARFRLDEVIHAPVRFSIVAALAHVEEADFAAVRDAVQVSDSVLSKQVTLLERAGYVEVKKGYVGKRPRTWLKLTPVGEAAFNGHLQALRAIAGP
ncbi:MAG TPA: transcriptional regulator [Dermatophilaceae bacterium]|nr:transcriptional regulator [Dermatophilaceae bacterium]